jgi:cytochrome c oxidase accessory protein FixG
MSAASPNDALIKHAGRVLSTLEEDGSRRWIYPKLARGTFWQLRRIVGYALIVIFVAIPYLTIHGKPLLLLDVAHRRFTLIGITFLPTDTILLALFGVSTLLFIFFVTALLGRVWCGWACPQTVYMEFLFRPLERLFSGRTGAGGKPVKPLGGVRKLGLYLSYFVASFFLAHTFLSYFVGVEQLRHWILQSPALHPAGFAIVAAVTALMMFNFSFFREQTCIIACPYGRFQSALLDRQSLIISYDRNRGEPRGALRKNVGLPVVHRGDCVDCDLCVAVCPTGIDIREGLQIECVGCAQCIDACNNVMRKVKRPTGLIRYSSQAAMDGEKLGLFRPRMVIYPSIILALLGLMTYLLLTHAPADVTLLRGLGRPWVLTENGDIENVIRVKIQNRTDNPQVLRISVADRPEVQAFAAHDSVTVPAWQAAVEPVRVVAPPALFPTGTLNIRIHVGGEGVGVDRPFRLVGPFAQSTQPTTHGETHAEH